MGVLVIFLRFGNGIGLYALIEFLKKLYNEK